MTLTRQTIAVLAALACIASCVASCVMAPSTQPSLPMTPVLAPEVAPPSLAAATSDPLHGDTRAHDPSLWIGNGGWYVFATGPGLQRLHSDDGTEWKRLAPIFTRANLPAWWADAVPAHKGVDVWAPKLFELGGRFHVMYSLSTFGKNTSAIGIASAESPDAADWRDDGLVLQSHAGDDFNAIDPDVFVDPDTGRVWMTYGSFWRGIRVTELDARTLRPIGATRFVADHQGGIEAPTLIRRGAWWYLFVSWDFCCRGVNSTYNIRVGRSASPTGPFVDQDGADMLQGHGRLVEAGGLRWKGPGHQDVFGDVLVRHAYDAQDNGVSHLRISTLRWSPDGWPAP
jgi:arabinan endo-1,5-alpha-L-arabinosidase